MECGGYDAALVCGHPLAGKPKSRCTSGLAPHSIGDRGNPGWTRTPWEQEGCFRSSISILGGSGVRAPLPHSLTPARKLYTIPDSRV